MTLKDLYQRPGFLLRRTHQISAAVFENACASVGLTPAQYGVLTVLSSEPGLDQTRLARALAFDKVTVMRVCKGLHRSMWAQPASGRRPKQPTTEVAGAAVHPLLLHRFGAMSKNPGPLLAILWAGVNRP